MSVLRLLPGLGLDHRHLGLHIFAHLRRSFVASEGHDWPLNLHGDGPDSTPPLWRGQLILEVVLYGSNRNTGDGGRCLEIRTLLAVGDDLTSLYLQRDFAHRVVQPNVLQRRIS